MERCPQHSKLCVPRNAFKQWVTVMKWNYVHVFCISFPQIPFTYINKWFPRQIYKSWQH